MTIEFSVPDMSCNHCVQTITAALQAHDAAIRVETDLARKRVIVHGSSNAAALTQVIRDAGYDAQTGEVS